jgi:hypothetical protein
MAHQIDPEILPPEQPQQKSLQLGPWVVPLKPKTVRALKGVAVTALLGWAGWFFQNFLQLRGVVNILASRVNLAFLWIFCFLACWLLTSGAVRKVLYRICLGVLLLVLVLCLDWWAPKPLAANPPPPFITVKVSPSAFPVSVAPRTTLYILPIHPYQTFTDAASHLHEFDNSCGEEHLWPTQEEINSKPPNGYEEVRRIEVTNHSQDAIESGRIAFSVLYNEAFGGGCMSPPASSAPQEDVIFVPAIDPGKSFEFVAVNQTNRCAWLIAPTTIRIRKANDATPINAPLKLEPTVVSTWLSSPFGPTTIKWVGVPIKNPGYGIARSGASCQSANDDIKRREARQHKLAQLMNQGIIIRSKWSQVMGQSEETQRTDSVEVPYWHTKIENYLRTLPRKDVYLAKLNSAHRTDFGYPIGINVNVAGNWDLLLLDLTSLKGFMDDPDFGKP